MMGDDFAKTFTETRQGKALWKTFLIAAIILLLAETIIGRPDHANMKNDPQ